MIIASELNYLRTGIQVLGQTKWSKSRSGVLSNYDKSMRAITRHRTTGWQRQVIVTETLTAKTADKIRMRN